MDSQEVQSSAQEVQFTVRVERGEENSVQPELFCCLYKDQDGRYSAFSPYLPLEGQQGVSVLLHFNLLHTLLCIKKEL